MNLTDKTSEDQMYSLLLHYFECLNVAATSRNSEALSTAVGLDDADFLPLRVDLTSEEEVGQAIEQTITHFGNIDVVVNNAGYGLTGSIEELSDEEARQNFDINVLYSVRCMSSVK